MRRIAKDNRNIKLTGSTCPHRTTAMVRCLRRMFRNGSEFTPKPFTQPRPWGIHLTEFRSESIWGSWCWWHHFQLPAGRRWPPPRARWRWNTERRPVWRKESDWSTMGFGPSVPSLLFKWHEETTAVVWPCCAVISVPWWPRPDGIWGHWVASSSVRLTCSRSHSRSEHTD